MGASQVEAKGFPSLDELTEVGVAAEQVVDEFSPLGLLPANHLAAGLGVTLGESRYCVIHDFQDRHSRRAHSRSVAGTNFSRELIPHTAGCREVEINPPADGNSLLRSAAALASYC